ncbi:MAG: hypothetical protein ACRDFZ_02300 [Candidatus Limnocylindria bacterium]
MPSLPIAETHMYFLEDRQQMALVDPVIIASAVLAIIAIGFGLWSRRELRRRPRRGPAYHVFRQDVASALLVWGVAQLALAAGWALRVEGLRMPIWSYLGLAIGLAIVAVAGRRERAAWPALAKTDGVELLPDGRVQRGTSQTWEMGFLAGAGLGLVSYLVSAGHAYGHPIHWVTTGLTLLAGYALGLAMWSPRFKLEAVRFRQVPAGGKRRRPTAADERRESGRTRTI